VETGEVAENCYSGSICRALARCGAPVTEDAVWALGGGFGLQVVTCGTSGAPTLAVDPVGTVARFAELRGVELEARPVTRAGLGDALAAALAEGRGVVVWTNSRHLAYGDSLYAGRGYLHALAIDGLDQASGLVEVSDTLVVSMPPKACRVAVPLATLANAMFDPAPLGDRHQGRILALRVARPVAPASRAELLARLRDICAASLAAMAPASPLVTFGTRCVGYAERATTPELVAYAGALSDAITTFSVVPSRRLFQAALAAAAVDAPVAAYEALLQAWKVLATLCLKIGMTGMKDGMARLEERLTEALAAERDYWRAVEARLNQANGDQKTC
jgi:hypothetical protein